MLPLSDLLSIVGLDTVALQFFVEPFINGVGFAALPVLGFVGFGGYLKKFSAELYAALRIAAMGYVAGMMIWPVTTGYVVYAVLFQMIMLLCGLMLVLGSHE